MKDNEILSEVINYLNDNYNQESENYSIVDGAKPEVIRYDEHTAISLWACGAIVCIEHIMYFIKEDDGYWFVSRSGGAAQDCFSLGWADSFINAMSSLQKFVKENGTPVYYSGTNEICHYTL